MYARFFRWASDRLDANGVLALITNRSFINSRTFDGFREVVEREFNIIYVVDLGGDVRDNPKLSGTKHRPRHGSTGSATAPRWNGYSISTRKKAEGPDHPSAVRHLPLPTTKNK